MYVGLSLTQSLTPAAGKELSFLVSLFCAVAQKSDKDHDANGFILATSTIVAGNHNDSYALVDRVKGLFQHLRACQLPLRGAYCNADSAFATKAVRKLLWNRGIHPNIPENRRGRKRPKRGPKRHFNRDVYTQRFVSERTFAWIDTFRRLGKWFEQKSVYFLGFHSIAYTLINLRDVLAKV